MYFFNQQNQIFRSQILPVYWPNLIKIKWKRRDASVFMGKLKMVMITVNYLSQFSTSLMIMIFCDHMPISGLQNLKYLPAVPLWKTFSHS